MKKDPNFECECGGQVKKLYTTEDEEKTYDYYKCNTCGDITRIAKNILNN